ncbi:putative potassium transporter [Helianthus annuus]|nr:putative potassium transporter [Helianthus annuus]
MFSIINQSQSLGYFPRVKVLHTSDNSRSNLHTRDQLDTHDPMHCYHYRFSRHQAHGKCIRLVEMAVMLVTTCLTYLAIILCWHKPPIIALYFMLFFGSIELLYFSAGAGTNYYAGVGF